jgi:four helix bundle protein
MSLSSYRELIVWQKAMDLVILIYAITKDFPTEERFGLVTQMRRSAVSIPSNIAEGSRRSTRKEYRQFLCIAYGSGAELETQLQVAVRLHYALPEKLHEADVLLNEVMKMLNAMLQKM